MAKQKGLHKLAGKVDEQSYYYSKNGGYQSRKINPGIGERVKTDPAYHNTRLNNAEFGAAGACAGAMIREVSKRWRYILDSIATGKMVKEIKALMEQDTTSPWGQRVVQLTHMSSVQEKYNQFSKNQMPEDVVDFLQTKVSYNGSTHKLVLNDSLDISDSLSDFLASINATGVRASLYVLNVVNPSFNSLTHRYNPIDASILLMVSSTSSSISVGTTILGDDEYDLAAAPTNTQTMYSGVLVVFEPIRTIGSTNNVLQQYCSAFWKEIA